MNNSTSPANRETPNQAHPNQPAPRHTPGDPRHDFAVVADTITDLIARVTADQWNLPTACPAFTVAGVAEHLVNNQRRLASLGRGETWSFHDEPVNGDFAAHFTEATNLVSEIWSAPGKLDELFEVPWGTMPGAALIGSYIGEQAVHAWDIAEATGLALQIDDELLRAPFEGLRLGLPADGRGPDIPFGDVVDPGPDASVLLQLAGWSGRPVRP